jgi:hypothetical protein
MNGGGPGSGIWKSTDAGETWTRLKGNGWPDGPLGRIAVDVYRKRPNILYALIEGPAPAGGRGRGAGAGGAGGAGAQTTTAPAAAQAAGGEEAATAAPGGGRSTNASTVTPNTPTGSIAPTMPARRGGK